MGSVRNVLRSVQLILIALLVVSCGGEGTGSPGAPVSSTATNTLSGTAAAGAAIVGQVTVKGSLGNTKSALIEADGTYNVDVTGLTAPYRLRAVGTVGGRTYKLHSYAEAADVGGNVNITPFTDLIVANAAGQIAESYFDSNTPADLDPTELAAQEDALQAKLQNVFTALGLGTAVDLLNQSFSADHSGLDAVLDMVRVDVDPALNVATITNLVENTSILDSVTDPADNTAPLTVADPTALTTGVNDIQGIAARLDAMTAAFAGGLPRRSDIEDFFTTDFFDEDTSLQLWLTDVTTDPDLVGLTFSNISVSNLDSTAGTAVVTFNASVNGVTDLEPITWLAARHATLGWQMRGNQRIADVYFNFHCNDNDGNGPFAGACGINTRFEDDDFTNNATGNAPIASGTVSVIDSGGATKGVIYLGVPSGAAPGDGQVYDEAGQNYTGDWKPFGTGLGQIAPAIFADGDVIKYDLYTQGLDLTNPAAPQIGGGVGPVATYRDSLPFTPFTTAKYPDATAATLTAISNFELGNDLLIAWTLATGTRNSEILVEVRDSAGNRIEIWDDTIGTTATNTTVASTALDSTAATGAGLDATATSYNLLVRIYAEDELTGQEYSRDYNATIPGPGGSSTATLGCAFESGWDDTADGGLGAPVTPNSFADYEGVLADCGTAQLITTIDVAGNTFTDSDGEIFTFNALGGASGTESDRGTGNLSDIASSIDFEWYIEAATCAGCTYSYLVIYTDDTLDSDLPVGLWFRETMALINVTGTPGNSGAAYDFRNYTEQGNFSDSDRSTGADGEIWSSTRTLQVGASSAALGCAFNSGWDDTADGGLGAPVTPKSFTDYEAVLADCGTALPIAAVDVEGKTFIDSDGEIFTFNALGGASGTESNRGTGNLMDGGSSIDFEWYVEAATCAGCTYSYLVMYSDDTLDSDLPVGLWFRETTALINVTGTPGNAGSIYDYRNYSEQGNYSDTDRSTGSDGEIWSSSRTLQ